MRKIRNPHKWFWITFFGWCFIAAAGAWALILSSFHLESKETSKFSIEINGLTETNRLLVCNAPINQSLEAVTRQWQAEGWKCNTRNLNLASLLLNLPKDDREKLDGLAQMRFFQKGGNFRLLGFLSDFDDNQTYEWISDIPAKALTGQKPSSVDFPLKPPPNAYQVFTMKSENIQTCVWSMSASTSAENQFIDDFTAQGFKGRLWSQHEGAHAYILQRSAVRLFAVLEINDKKSTISVVKLGKN